MEERTRGRSGKSRSSTSRYIPAPHITTKPDPPLLSLSPLYPSPLHLPKAPLSYYLPIHKLYHLISLNPFPISRPKPL